MPKNSGLGTSAKHQRQYNASALRTVKRMIAKGQSFEGITNDRTLRVHLQERESEPATTPRVTAEEADALVAALPALPSSLPQPAPTPGPTAPASGPVRRSTVMDIAPSPSPPGVVEAPRPPAPVAVPEATPAAAAPDPPPDEPSDGHDSSSDESVAAATPRLSKRSRPTSPVSPPRVRCSSDSHITAPGLIRTRQRGRR